MIRLVLLFIFCILSPFALERMAVLPTLSLDEDKKLAREFRFKLINLIEENEQFQVIAGDVLKQTYKDFRILKLNSDNNYLFRMGLVVNAAKICFSQIVIKNSVKNLFIKVYDCQMKEKFLVYTTPINNKISLIAESVYKEMKKNYLSRNDYIDSISNLKLSQEKLTEIESAGGTVEGRILLEPYGITHDQYRTVTLMAGSAKELTGFLERKLSIAYYLKYLSYVYNLPIVR